MMRRLWCEKAEALPTGGTPREVRRRSGARLSRGVVARESARERGLPRASFASSSFSTFSGRRAFGSAAGLSRENPVGSWRVPHLSSSLSFLAMSMAPPKAAVAICAGGGAEGDGASDAPARVSRNAARTRREVRRPPGVPSASRRPAFRARRGKRRLPGRDRARTARAREGGGRAHRRADEPGHELLLILPPLLVGVVVSHRRSFGGGSSGSLSFAPGFVARRRRSGRRSRATTPILVGRGSLRLGRNDRRRDGGASETTSLGGFEGAFRELPEMKYKSAGGTPRPPATSRGGSGSPRARRWNRPRITRRPWTRTRSTRARPIRTTPRRCDPAAVSRARDGVSRVAVRDETALPNPRRVRRPHRATPTRRCPPDPTRPPRTGPSPRRSPPEARASPPRTPRTRTPRSRGWT